jgi:hypothetical protein
MEGRGRKNDESDARAMESEKRAIGALCNLEKEVVSEMLQEQLLLLRPCRTASSETMR